MNVEQSFSSKVEAAADNHHPADFQAAAEQLCLLAIRDLTGQHRKLAMKAAVALASLAALLEDE